MTNEKIKKECEAAYKQIELAHERLKDLRDVCKHEKTYEGNYSWRIGSIMPAEICYYCGDVIRFIADEATFSTQSEQRNKQS